MMMNEADVSMGSNFESSTSIRGCSTVLPFSVTSEELAVLVVVQQGHREMASIHSVAGGDGTFNIRVLHEHPQSAVIVVIKCA